MDGHDLIATLLATGTVAALNAVVFLRTAGHGVDPSSIAVWQDRPSRDPGTSPSYCDSRPPRAQSPSTLMNHVHADPAPYRREFMARQSGGQS